MSRASSTTGWADNLRETLGKRSSNSKPKVDGVSTRPRAMVTGGAGFLGSHLCERLIVEGYDVICLDNLLTGQLRNIQDLTNHPQFKFVEHDVTTPIEFEGPLDHILHFASPASPKDYAQHPIHTLKVGSLGTHNMLGLARAKKASFLLASSSEVYGDPQVSPQSEDYWGHVNPVGPRSVYDEAKRFAEAITMAYHREHAADARIARIFNCFGPRLRVDDGRALPTFTVQALRNEPLSVYGDGSQTRSFCYVDDLIEGIFRLHEFEFEPSAAYSQRVVNLGNPEEMTVLQLAQSLIDLTGSESRIEFGPLPVDDPKRRCPDITNARTMLGWDPTVSTEQGLRKTIPHIRKLIDVGVT